MNDKFLLLIVGIVLFLSSPIFAMDQFNSWESQLSSHPIICINIQRTNSLSPEQLEDLYKTGHLLSEEGWYHVGQWNDDHRSIIVA